MTLFDLLSVLGKDAPILIMDTASDPKEVVCSGRVDRCREVEAVTSCYGRRIEKINVTLYPRKKRRALGKPVLYITLGEEVTND
jgi:hypothetical protein